MRGIVTVLLLIGFCRAAAGQTPIQITGACPGSLAASSNYPTGVTVALIGTGFTKTTQIRSSHTVSSAYISPTQMQVTLLGSDLATPGAIDLTAVDNRAALAVTTTALPSGTMNVAYVASVSASGGETPYAWSATGLPAGLQINSASGIISGTPTGFGTSTAVVTVQDAGNPSQTASVSLPITINPTLAITRTALPQWDVNAPNYSATVLATGGTAPYTWSATLPAGLSVNASTGVISGTPGQAGFSMVSVIVTDSSQPQQFALATLPITINGPLTIPAATLNLNGTDNYMANVMASGGTQPYTWSANNLPYGLTLNSNGTIGENAGLGTFAVTVTVTPGLGATGTAFPILVVTDAAQQTAFATICLDCGSTTVRVDKPRFTVTSNTLNLSILAPATLSTLTPTQTTVTAPLTLNISGGPFIAPAQGCPTGTPNTTLIWNENKSNTTLTALTVAPNSILAPIPNSLVTQGTVNVAVQDPFGVTTSSPLSLIINPIPQITTTSLPNGIAGKPYSTPIAAAGGTLPFAWSIVTTGSGLSIDSNGVLSGTLPTSGPVSVMVMLRDAVSVIATATVSIPVLPLPSVSLSVQTNPIVLLTQQNSVTVALAQPVQGMVTGNLSLQFQSDSSVAANPDTADPALSLTPTQFTIKSPATTMQAFLQPGLTAGMLTVTASNIQLNGVDVTPAALPATTLKIPPAPPTLQSACLVRQPSSGLGVDTFNVSVTGFSNTREVSQVQFRFTGSQLGTNEVDFNNAGSLFGPYYNANFLPFNYQQTLQVSGNPNDVGGVSVILVNKEGPSQAVPMATSCP